MANYDNQDWIDSIQNAASDIGASHPLGIKAVSHVLHSFGAKSFDDLSPCDYADAFNELSYIADDLRH